MNASVLGSRPGLGGVLLMGCVVVLNSPAARASDAIPSPLVPVAYAGDAGELAVAGVRTALDAGLYAQAKQSHKTTFEDFALGRGLSVDLELEQFSVLAPDAQLVVASDAGEVQTPLPDMAMFRGKIIGDETSTVVVTLSPLGTNGFIRSSLGTFIIASDERGGAYVYNTADAADVAISIPPCLGGLTPPDGHAAELGVPPGGFEATSCRIVRVAVDTDWEYRSISKFTSDAAAQTYALTLWGAVSEIYRADMNVSLEVPYLRIWSSNTDPYPDGSVIGDRLTQFRSHWISTKGSVARNVAHLLSATGGGGVAWVGVLCNNSYGYGADGSLSGSFPKPVKDHQSQNWDLMVTAHELGHNFNAPHTHDMSPQIDGCGTGDCSQAYGGTIMSYCHTCAGGMTNMVLSFHERTLSEKILPYLAGTAASCGTTLTAVQISSNPTTFQAQRAGTAAEFEMVASGQSPAYSWTFNGKALVDGPTLFGAVISGATTSKLRVSNLSTKDIGTYRGTVSNGCSSVSSSNASLSVRCASDMNLDSKVDLDDFFSFFNCFDEQGLCADMNADDVVDLSDFFTFFNAFDRGC